MLCYTTNLNLPEFEYLAVSLVLTLTSAVTILVQK